MPSSSPPPPAALDAKVVVLGSQGVGKTSLVHRFVKNAFIPTNKAQSTVGASFCTTRVHDPETGAILRLQIWDTAGQERFRSISRLYYRGAHCAILCYDVTSRKSFNDMAVWIKELKENCGLQNEGDLIIHVVGTKTDVVAADPSKRQVPFERCIGYVAEQLYPESINPAGTVAQPTGHATRGPSAVFSPPGSQALVSPQSNRSSGFWGQDQVWDCCHEISAKDGEGIEEVFRVITRKLVEQSTRRAESQRKLEEAASRGRTPGSEGGVTGYFDLPNANNGSFRVGRGDKRRSWMGFPTPSALTSFTSYGGDDVADDEVAKGMRQRRCC